MPEGHIPWKESNLALIGSDLDRKIKQAAAERENQWQGLGTAAGLYIWRIEKFCVVPWPKADYGKFYRGDSYVVLNSYKRDGSNALNHDVHIWIGSESSQDEYGTAAYKMVEADDFLGGAAVQHRETEGHESPLFQSYFDYNLEYWQGGIESGFRHVEPTVDTPSLYRVKGTEKGLSLTQVALKKSSLNEGDSFILVANNANVWVWHGSSANPDEKFRAGSLGEKMCTRGTVVTMEHGHGDDEVTAFWAYLGEGEIAPADPHDADVVNFAPVLYRLSDDPNVGPQQVGKAGSQVKFGRPNPPIPRSLLNQNDTFLLDGGWEIFLWIGKDSTTSEKLAAMATADNYCKGDPRTADLPLTIIKSGQESSAFNMFFG